MNYVFREYTIEDFPQELKNIQQWFIAGPDKRPHTVVSEKLVAGSVTDPSGFLKFYDALKFAQKFDCNIGFVLTAGCGYTCIDLDVKEGTSKEIIDRHIKIIKWFDSYTEYSLSGKGLHIWVKGEIGKGCRRDGVEVYSQERFIICTGKPLENHNMVIEYRQTWLDILVKEMSGNKNEEVGLIEIEQYLTDEEVWAMGLGAANSEKFKGLCACKNTQDAQDLGYPSQSEADLSLLSMLCFYTKCNSQVRRLFRETSLGKRDKAIKDDRYINRTLVGIRSRQNAEEVDLQYGKQIAQIFERDHKEKVEKEIKENAKKVKLNKDNEDNLVKIDWPPGFCGELARWACANSPREVKEIAITTTLGILAGIYGRSYNVGYNLRTGLNLYLLVIAESGAGKDALNTIPSLLISILNSIGCDIDEYLTFDKHRSGAGLITSLSTNEKGSCCNFQSEFGQYLHRLGNLKDGNANAIKEEELQIFSKSNVNGIIGRSTRSREENTTKKFRNFAYSIAGESSPQIFFESMSQILLFDGYISRFVIIPHNGEIPYTNRKPSSPLPESVLYSLKNGIEYIQTISSNDAHHINLEGEVEQEMIKYDNMCTDAGNLLENENPERSLWNRASIKVLKISALLAVADNARNPVITIEHFNWAKSLVQLGISTIKHKLKKGDIGNDGEVRYKKVESIIQEYVNKPVSKGYYVHPELQKSFIISRNYLNIRISSLNSFKNSNVDPGTLLNNIINFLIQNGKLKEVNNNDFPEKWNMKGKHFLINLNDGE